jgi:hypothetical protein
MTARDLLTTVLRRRAGADALAWIEAASREAAAASGAVGPRFATLIAQASRKLPRGPLAPTDAERAQAEDLVRGWNPERWSLLDAGRAVLVLSRADLDRPSGPAAVEDCFRYADVGELVALYRALCLLPQPQAYVWRAGEGCRSSMGAVFEAAACDTPFPFHHFDDVAWRQLVIKAVFVGAPLWRVFGLDQRLDEEVARMALDLVEERRSAGRPVQADLWLCLSRFGGERAQASLEHEIAQGAARGRAAAGVALARAGRLERLSELREQERDAAVARAWELALKGLFHQGAWRDLPA